MIYPPLPPRAKYRDAGETQNEKDEIWGVRRDPEFIQVTIGSGDRGFDLYTNAVARRLIGKLRRPDFKFRLCGIELSERQRERLASVLDAIFSEDGDGSGNFGGS